MNELQFEELETLTPQEINRQKREDDKIVDIVKEMKFMTHWRYEELRKIAYLWDKGLNDLEIAECLNLRRPKKKSYSYATLTRTDVQFAIFYLIKKNYVSRGL